MNGPGRTVSLFLVLALLVLGAVGLATAADNTVTSVSVSTVESGGGMGLDVDVAADTSLDDTDTLGNDPGEPYFVLLVDGQAVGRTGVVTRSESYSDTITIGPDSLSGLSAGKHSMTVQLYDQDSGDFDPSGDDDFLSERSGTFSLDTPAQLTLRSSRSSVPVGSVVSIEASGDTGESIDWRLASAPSGSDATVRAHNDATVTVRPDQAGTYTVRATAATGASGSVTIEASTAASQSLLRTYAPRVHFDREERYFPTRYEAFVANAALEDFGQDNVERPSMFDLAGRSDAWELDLHGSSSDYPSYDDGYPATVYGSVHEDVTFRGEQYTAVTYWLFYVYDPKNPDGISSLIAHQSDLETVTILLQNGEPRWVGASQHHGGELREWEKTPKAETHVDVYPAVGAHSNFLRNTERYDGGEIPGQNQFAFTDSLSANLLGVPYADTTGDDTLWTPSSGGDVRYQIVPLTGNEIWATYQGAFGSSDGEGLVPMGRDRWQQPGNWMESSLPSDEAQIGGAITDSTFALDGSGHLDATVAVANGGSKPHRMWALLEVKPADATWSGSDSKIVATGDLAVEVGGERSTTLAGEISGLGGEIDARVRLTAYSPELVEPEDVLATATATDSFAVAAETPTPLPTETATPMPRETATPTQAKTDTATAATASSTAEPPSSRTGTPGREPTADRDTEAPVSPPETAESTTDATGPGFGVPVAVLSMTLAVFVGLRRYRVG